MTLLDAPSGRTPVAPGSAATQLLARRAPLAPPSSVNLPNALTVGRLLIIPVFAVVLLGGMDTTAGRLLAWALFTAACLTDVVDGRLARSRGQVTAFGVIADPIADKTLVGTALVGLSVLGLLPWWATAVILLREVAVTALRAVVARHGLMPASRGGKLKCLSQNVAVAAYLLPLAGAWTSVRAPLLWLAVGATVVTGADYALRGLRLARTSS